MIEYTKVYTHGGRVAHLMDPTKSPNSYAGALCNFSPNWPWEWQGTGNQDERDEAARRPVCRYCIKVRDGLPWHSR